MHFVTDLYTFPDISIPDTDGAVPATTGHNTQSSSHVLYLRRLVSQLFIVCKDVARVKRLTVRRGAPSEDQQAVGPSGPMLR